MTAGFGLVDTSGFPKLKKFDGYLRKRINLANMIFINGVVVEVEDRFLKWFPG